MVRYGLVGIALLACVLPVSGCLEMVRRAPTATMGEREGPDEVIPEAERRNRKPPDGVQDSMEMADSAAIARSVIPGSSREREPESRHDRERVKRVNAYALWCIERGMWDEARSHMERALERDSLAASLHNNLAIVYEHLGEDARAEKLYRRAIELAVDGEEYRQNLHRLERRQQTAADTSEASGLFELNRPEPGSQSAPD